MNTDVRRPSTASELRTLCEGWPLAVVRHAVAAVVPGPEAAVIAAWLTDPAAPADALPLPPDAISKIARHVRAQRH